MSYGGLLGGRGKRKRDFSEFNNYMKSQGKNLKSVDAASNVGMCSTLRFLLSVFTYDPIQLIIFWRIP